MTASQQRPTAVAGRGQKRVERVADQLEKPSLDDRTYRVIRLSNQLEVLLVHDPDTDKASAAMDVNVGAFSDEEDMPGMAHAVEHLLFMGTKKYPVENEYAQYLSSNSGSSNAYTGSTSTNYYFEVSAKPSNDEEPSAENPSALYGALDRFAQFFVEPLFLASTLDRELQAVDSENKKNLQSDQWRLHQLEKSLCNPKHPYHHFSTGNLQVLKTEPESRGINVRDKFIEFYEKHYSANRMKLCVLGREPLDVLENWVAELFSDVNNKDLEQNRWTDEVPFNKEQLGLQCFAKPVMDSRELNLLFPFLDEEYLYESQPSQYISHLIGHEGPGSIMAYIKSKGWANGLSAGAYPVCPGTLGVFDIQIRLTEEGLKNYKEVVKVIFQYVSMLRESPPQKWIFEEQKGMADVDFKFKQKTPASRFTSKTSSVMQKPLPREWLLSSRLRKFEPELIRQGIDLLRPDNFRMSIVSRDFPGKWDKKEKWYGTEHTVSKIEPDFMQELKKAVSLSTKERIQNLHLPHKNQFIPTKLEVEKKDVKEPALAPRMIRNDDLVRTWYKKDDTFWVPKANLIVSCKSPIIYASAENSVKARLFADLVRDALEEYSYDAELAGLQYNVSLDSRGLFIEVSGYNDKLPVLLEQVLITMRDLEIRDDRFDIIKERLTRGYRNWELQQPFTQISEYTSWLITEHDHVVEELSAELPAITATDVRNFRKELLAQLHMEVYAHGNFYKEDALKLTDMIESTLKPRVLPRNQWPIQRSLLFSPGSNFLWKKTLKDPANVNHCIEYWLYIGDKADRDVRAKTLLLDQVVHEPAFDQLRTKEQLGYVVFSGARTGPTTYGFRFIIQSEKKAEYLETRIESFLTTFAETLEKMEEKDFENHKRSLIVKRLEKPKYLDQETNRHWNQIHSEYYDFESAQQDAAHIKPLTKADLIEFFSQYIHPKSPARAKLAIYLVAQAKSDVSTKQISELIKTLALDTETSAKAATDLQARLSAAGHDEEKEVDGLKNYLLHDLLVAEDKIEAAVATWKKLHAANGAKVEGLEDQAPPSANGKEAVVIEDVRMYKAGQIASTGALPAKDLKLHRQLTFTTSSQKKRRITRQSAREPDLDNTNNTSPDLVLPSTEDESDPCFSFTTAPDSGLSTPTYVRSDSVPVSGVPPRLQTSHNSFTAPDYTSSAASSPCAASTDLSFDNDRGADGLDSGSALHPPSSKPQPSLVYAAHRAIIGGAADINQRSSSPLKRRASSMDQDLNGKTDTKEEDVDMIVLPHPSPATQGSASSDDDASPPIAAVDGSIDQTSDSQNTLVAEQGLPIRRGDANHASGSTNSEPTTRADVPPIAEQIQTIQNLLKAFQEAPLEEGDNWLERALAFGSGAKNAGKGSDDVALGLVDNSDIIQAAFTDAIGQEFVKLRPGLGQDNFELFSKDAWDLLVAWHGLADGQRPIIRTAHNTNPDTSGLPNIQYEFYPPVFSIHRVWSASSPLPIEQSLKLRNPPPPLIVHSSSYRLHDFLKEAKNHAGVPLDTKTLPAGGTASPPAGLSTPPSSPGPADVVPGSFQHLLVEVDSFLKLERGVERDVIEAHDSTHHANYNGSRSLAMTGLTVDQALVLDENIGKKDEWVSTCLASRGSSNSLVAKATGSGRNSPAPGPTTRGRAQQQQRSGKTLGCVGLQNLGNTCYMNSALQCVRSVEELTKYFLTHEAEKEVNPDNPLSFNGDVARAYGRLLEEIYRDPPPNSVAPRQFKNVIGRYAPSFSGYGQQDSQEFLGFLLDGLQEDLNRIKKKPYIEKPDSTDEMIGNPAAIREMADKVWDITKKRDDSVIADLFTGLYQSTLVCPVCSKVSITFDPFTNLTLPLPVASVWTHTVKYFPLNEPPVEITVELDKNSSIKAMKEFVSARVGVPVARLMAAEEFRDKFFKLYEDLSSVSEEIQMNDHPAVHELEAVPTNVPVVKLVKKQKYRSLLEPDEPEEVPVWEEPSSQRIAVPVIHRIVSAESKYSRRKPAATSPPHFIVLTPEEARSEDVIRRKILEKVATFSTHSSLHEDDSAESTEPELVTTSSDGDSQVVAKSVEGEEELVDVTMNDAAASPAASSKYPLQLRKFNTRRPKFVDPKEFLDPQLQNLFELCYFTENDYNIPSGWQTIQENTPLPKLSSRLPKPAASDVEMNSPTATWDGSEDSGSDEIPDSQPSTTTRMVDESSDDSSDIPAAAPSKVKAHKTYGKGAKKRPQNPYSRQPSESIDVEEEHAFDNGPLVRYGEGIVVDWTEDTWDEIYSGTDPGDAEGMPTFVNIEKLEDDDLKQRQQRRSARRKNGITLDDCLGEFEKEEILSEQDTWYCPRCKEHRRASKKFDLWKTPDILAVHLKRFSSAGWRREKLDVHVDFPIEGLDLTSRVIDKEDGKQEIYDLIAVDDHWGGLGGGHYTAFARNFIDGEWYNYNDTSVSRQNNVSKIVTSAAYLLFYRRRSDVPLGGPKFQEIFERYDNQTQETEDSDSGEGQRLGHGSSPRGSSSALQTGAGATLRSGRAGLGSALATTGAGGDAADLEGDVAEDAAGDDGLPGLVNWHPEDEGVDMREEYTLEPVARRSSGNLSEAVRTGWNFEAIQGASGGLARSEADDGMGLGDADDDADSTTAQNDTSSSLDDMADEEASFPTVLGGAPYVHDNGDLEPMLQDGSMPEPGGDYVLPDEPHPHPVMFDEPPPPAYDELELELGGPAMTGVVVTAEQIADEVGHAEHVDQVVGESRVTEIHIADDDDDAIPDAPAKASDAQT
ncbi:UCH-domain-containing protein [Coniochaeta ligniaria NRRL 30616]|uniref:UCH-domain-containing protein n=1 Tax=Coniochaeta ligniaria NRRL 30616 TaxID=1408157 RepID=A0A1J7J1W1_9PEZI|nr:UCH-domain-containing protein [Coniochaeta ligniaria NRRL 30616]